MLQLIDPDSALRIDVFRAYGATMRMTVRLDLPTGMPQLISREDLVARAARLALDLASDRTDARGTGAEAGLGCLGRHRVQIGIHFHRACHPPATSLLDAPGRRDLSGWVNGAGAILRPLERDCPTPSDNR